MKRILLLSLVSFAFFFAKGQALQLEHPTKGDVWPAFTKQKIEWTIANVDNIKIEISTDSARTWSVIQTSYPASAGKYEWTVINEPSDSCFIRITDVANSSVSSSNYPVNPFKIPNPEIRIENIPNEVFGGTPVPLYWGSFGIQTVRILASYNNGISFTRIADNIPAGNGFYNWIAKDTNAINCIIIIQSTNNIYTADTIDQRFTIKQLPISNPAKFRGGSYDGHSSATNKEKSIVLVTPNSKLELIGNNNFSIAWASISVNQVNIKYSIDSGTNWTTIADNITAAQSNYSWNVPSTPSNNCLVKIEDAADPTFFDISDVSFSIKSNTIRLISPLNGDIGYKGQVLPIEWTSQGFNKIKISYKDGTTWKTIKETDANAEVWNWTIPNNIAASVHIKVSNVADELQFDTIFGITIKTAPGISAAKYRGGSFDGHSSGTNMTPHLTVTGPNSNIHVPSAIQYNITWSSLGVNKVDIAFSGNNGKNWTNVVNSYVNTGNYLWTVPGIVSSECLIKIKDSDDSTLNDVSDATFTILPKNIKIVVDTTTNKFFGTALPIQWTSLGIDKINLYFKTTAGGNWQVIKEALPAAFEQYNWTIPKLFGDSLWLKIADAENILVQDEKLIVGLFKALPTASVTKYRGGSFDGHSYRSTNNRINITRPAVTDTLLSGSKFPIKWNSGNVTDSVTLQYSTDSGRTWKVISNAPAIAGQFQWTVPSELSNRTSNGVSFRTATALLSDRCVVRAVQSNANEIVGISNQTFSIIQSVTITDSIISFTGNYIPEKVELNWTVEKEVNVTQYNIEKSFDGSEFRFIGKVMAINQEKYNYFDDVRENQGQKVFYRVKSIKKDNIYFYSPTIALNIPNNTTPVITDSVNTTPVITDSVNNDPVITDSVNNDPVIIDSVNTDPVITDPVDTIPVITTPVIIPPIINNPVIITPIPTVNNPISNSPSLNNIINNINNITINNVNFNAYPNPAKSFVQVIFDRNVTGLVEIEVTDVSGKLFIRKSVRADLYNIKLNTDNLNPGIYLLKLVQNGKKKTQRIIISP